MYMYMVWACLHLHVLLVFIQYERQSEKQEVEELLDRVDTELKDIWAAIAKAVSLAECVAMYVVCEHTHMRLFACTISCA